MVEDWNLECQYSFECGQHDILRPRLLNISVSLWGWETSSQTPLIHAVLNIAMTLFDDFKPEAVLLWRPSILVSTVAFTFFSLGMIGSFKLVTGTEVSNAWSSTIAKSTCDKNGSGIT